MKKVIFFVFIVGISNNILPMLMPLSSNSLFYRTPKNRIAKRRFASKEIILLNAMLHNKGKNKFSSNKIKEQLNLKEFGFEYVNNQSKSGSEVVKYLIYSRKVGIPFKDAMDLLSPKFLLNRKKESELEEIYEEDQILKSIPYRLANIKIQEAKYVGEIYKFIKDSKQLKMPIEEILEIFGDDQSTREIIESIYNQKE